MEPLDRNSCFRNGLQQDIDVSDIGYIMNGYVFISHDSRRKYAQRRIFRAADCYFTA